MRPFCNQVIHPSRIVSILSRVQHESIQVSEDIKKIYTQDEAKYSKYHDSKEVENI